MTLFSNSEKQRWIDQFTETQAKQLMEEKGRKELCEYTDCTRGIRENTSDGSLNLCAEHEIMLQKSLRSIVTFIKNDLLAWLVSEASKASAEAKTSSSEASSEALKPKVAKVLDYYGDPIFFSYSNEEDLLIQFITTEMAILMLSDPVDYAYKCTRKYVGNQESWEILDDDPWVLIKIHAKRIAAKKLTICTDYSNQFYNMGQHLTSLISIYQK